MSEIEFLGETRERSLTTTSVGGYITTSSGSILATRNIDSPVLYSLDYWHKKPRLNGSLPSTPCLITRKWNNPVVMNRNTGTIQYVHCPVSNQGSSSSGDFDPIRPPRGSQARAQENAVLVQELLANTNPFRTEFSVPAAIKDLAECSAMFKIAAKGFANFIGSNYLNYKFGWVLFLKDIQTLSSITTSLERRIRELQSLSKHGGIRRKLHLRSNSYSTVEADKAINSSYSTTVRATLSRSFSCTTHGTVRWRWVPGFDANLDKLAAFNLAILKVFDLDTLDSQTVWNLIPFSWLVDYFVDLDAFFGAQLGKGVIEPYDICIVRKCTSRSAVKVTSKPSSVTTSDGQFGMSEYDRETATRGSFPAVRVDLINRNQLATIAALLASFKR